jgi:hypothetical protein
VCTSKQFKSLNFTKQQGGVSKLIKTEKTWFHNLALLISISFFNYSKQVFQP